MAPPSTGPSQGVQLRAKKPVAKSVTPKAKEGKNPKPILPKGSESAWKKAACKPENVPPRGSKSGGCTKPKANAAAKVKGSFCIGKGGKAPPQQDSLDVGAGKGLSANTRNTIKAKDNNRLGDVESSPRPSSAGKRKRTRRRRARGKQKMEIARGTVNVIAEELSRAKTREPKGDDMFTVRLDNADLEASKAALWSQAKAKIQLPMIQSVQTTRKGNVVICIDDADTRAIMCGLEGLKVEKPEHLRAHSDI